MNKFLFSSLINEIYQEILYLTYNYQKEKITAKEIRVLGTKEYDDLKKSKNLKLMTDRIISLRPDGIYTLDDEFLNILERADYDKESLTYIVEYMNPFIDYYREMMGKIEKTISETLDIKLKSEGYEGEYPVYIKLEENMCTIERAILLTNAREYLSKETKKFGYKVSYVDYEVPLKEYSFNGKDLRGLDKKEIFKIMDNSIKVNLNDSKYYISTLKEIDIDNEEIELLSLGESSLWLNKRDMTYDGIKTVMKKSMKSTLFTLLILIIFTAIIIFIKYFK